MAVEGKTPSRNDTATQTPLPSPRSGQLKPRDANCSRADDGRCARFDPDATEGPPATNPAASQPRPRLVTCTVPVTWRCGHGALLQRCTAGVNLRSHALSICQGSLRASGGGGQGGSLIWQQVA